MEESFFAICFHLKRRTLSLPPCAWYRARRIDAYVSAALRLVDAGEADGVVGLPRSRRITCPGREDAAFALMRAQAAVVSASGYGNLSAVREASCRGALGIDPGDRMRKCTASCSMGKPMQKVGRMKLLGDGSLFA